MRFTWARTILTRNVLIERPNIASSSGNMVRGSLSNEHTFGAHKRILLVDEKSARNHDSCRIDKVSRVISKPYRMNLLWLSSVDTHCTIL